MKFYSKKLFRNDHFPLEKVTMKIFLSSMCICYIKSPYAWRVLLMNTAALLVSATWIYKYTYIVFGTFNSAVDLLNYFPSSSYRLYSVPINVSELTKIKWIKIYCAVIFAIIIEIMKCKMFENHCIHIPHYP